MSSPIRVMAYNKSFQPLGPIGDPIEVTITPQRMAPGVATVTVRGDHHLIPKLVQPGARLRLLDDDLADEDTDGQASHLLSGFVADWSVSGPERRSLVTLSVTGDFVTLHEVLGWVVPGSGITQQGSAGTNWEMEGPAETVLKAALQANAVDRLGLPIHIPASEGRGSTVKAKLRFQSLYDRLIPADDGAGIEKSGIEIGLRQLPDGHPDGPGLVLDVWEPRVVPQVLNEESGIVEEWSINHSAPSVTRAVISGEGESTLRLMRERHSAALESEINWKREVFEEAGQTDDPNEMYDRADEIIAEGVAKSGLSVTLSESDFFSAHPTRLWVGDQVTLNLAGQAITERLEEVTLSWTASEGRKSISQVGDRTDDPDRGLIKKVRAMARKLRIRSTNNV